MVIRSIEREMEFKGAGGSGRGWTAFELVMMIVLMIGGLGMFLSSLKNIEDKK